MIRRHIDRMWPLAALVLCLLGFGLRVHHLTTQSFWMDEGYTYHISVWKASDILRATFGVEPNPPLYYLLIHYWIQVVGTTMFSYRFVSVLPSVLTIALVYRLGRDLFTPPIAFGAALLAAVSPYLIWYAQEARAFALLACLATASLLAVWRASRRGGVGRWVVAAVLLTLTLYTHFYGVFVLGAALAFVLLDSIRSRPWRSLWLPAGAFVGPVVAYLPWIVANLHTGKDWRPPVGLVTIAGDSLTSFTHGGFLRGAVGEAVVVGEVGAVVAYLVTIVRQQKAARRAGLLVASALILPTFAVAALSVVQPIFSTRYVIGQAPVYYLAVAAGLAALLQRSPRLAGPLYLVLVALSLAGVLIADGDPRFRKEDFRGAASYLANRTTSSDAILVAAGYVLYPFSYYFHGAGQITPLMSGFDRAGVTIAPLIQGRDRVWLLLSHDDQVDPNDQLHHWLAARYPEVSEAFPAGGRIYGYRIQYQRDDVPSRAARLDVLYGGSIELAGATADSGISPTDDEFHPPSNWVHVTLYWRDLIAVTQNDRVSVRLVDQRGVWGESLARSNDAFAFYPTSRWKLGQVIVEDVDVNLNPVTPPGPYNLEVRLLGPDGQPLPTSGNPVVQSIRIDPSPAAGAWTRLPPWLR